VVTSDIPVATTVVPVELPVIPEVQERPGHRPITPLAELPMLLAAAVMRLVVVDTPVVAVTPVAAVTDKHACSLDRRVPTMARP